MKSAPSRAIAPTLSLADAYDREQACRAWTKLAEQIAEDWARAAEHVERPVESGEPAIEQ